MVQRQCVCRRCEGTAGGYCLEVALSQFLLGNGNPTRERGLNHCVFFPRLRVGFPKSAPSKGYRATAPTDKPTEISNRLLGR